MSGKKKNKVGTEKLYGILGIVFLVMGIMEYFVSLISEEMREYLLFIMSMIISVIFSVTADIIKEIRKNNKNNE